MANNENGKKVLYIKEASKYLGVHPMTLRRWDNFGRFPAKRDWNGRRVWEMSDLKQIKEDMAKYSFPHAGA